MKRWRILSLALLALTLCCGVAYAGVVNTHYNGLETYDGKIYSLETKENHEDGYIYSPSHVVEYKQESNGDLTELRRLILSNDEGAAKSSNGFVLHDGKLYISSFGKVHGGPEEAWGDVWTVDIAAWEAKRVLGMEKLSENPAGVSALDVTPDGTVFIITGGYYPDQDFKYFGKLYTTTVDKLSQGDAGDGVDFETLGGYSFLEWSEFDQVLWVMVGTGKIEARAKDGSTILRTFTPAELGNNPCGGLVALNGRTGLFYLAAPDNYANNSAGFITKSGSDYVVKEVLVNLAGASSCFALNDKNGNTNILLDEYVWGPGTNDAISIYSPDDFSKPIINTSAWNVANVDSCTTLGDYLYLGTNVNYDAESEVEKLSGKIAKGNLPDASEPTPVPDDETPNNDDNSNTGGSGGGGCDAGFGAAALLLVSTALRRDRKK